MLGDAFEARGWRAGWALRALADAEGAGRELALGAGFRADAGGRGLQEARIAAGEEQGDCDDEDFDGAVHLGSFMSATAFSTTVPAKKSGFVSV